MNEAIRKRKSVRKYASEPLDSATLEWVQEQIAAVMPLYPNIRYKIEIVNKTKGLFNVKAPHYLIFSSHEGEGYLENIGFIGQQLNLSFSERGIGSCWLGTSKPLENSEPSIPFVIAMAFGTAAEPVHCDVSEFKRKPLSAVSEGEDSRLEAARLAPSAVNSQNWYFVAEKGNIHCYRRKANPLLGFMLTTANQIDMGITLYHIASESDTFKFAKLKSVSAHKGCFYMGTVSD